MYIRKDKCVLYHIVYIMERPICINLVVCYNNEDELFKYADNLSRLNGNELLSLVVNINSLCKYTFEEFTVELTKRFRNVHVYSSGKNLGYLNGMLYAGRCVEQSEEIDLSNCKYVIMSNTDIVFEDYDFFSKLLGKEYDSHVAVIGPCVINGTDRTYGNPQYIQRYTKKSLDRRIFVFSHPYVSFFYFKLAKLKAKKLKNVRAESGNVYSCHGCFFILKKEFFDILKKYEYGCLMYSEEAYVAEYARIYGYKEYYDSTLEVIHAESTTTSLLGNKKKSKMFAESLIYIKNKFFE